MSDPASLTTAQLAQDQLFNVRCQIIAIQYAVNVVLPENVNTALHAERSALAARVIQRRVSPEMLAQIVLTDPNIAASAIADLANNAKAVADINIDGRIQATWNSLAVAAV